MSAPSLNRKLVLEERVRVPDGAGGFGEGWAMKGTLWANLDSRTGVERRIGGRVLPVVKYRILTRSAPFGADSRPRPEQRFRDGTRVFDILAVGDFDAAGRYLEIWAEEGRL